MIKVTTTHGKVFEGDLFAIDPVTKSLSLKLAHGGFAVLNAQHIASVSGNLTDAKAADFAKLGVQNVDDLEARECASLKQVEKTLENVNLGVSSNVQALFDKFYSIYNSTRWVGESIEILDEYLIEPPYEQVKVVAGKSGAALARMTSMLETERRKQSNA